MDSHLWKKMARNFQNSKGHQRNTVKIWSRGSVILPAFVGKTVEVHQGKNFVRLLVTEDMIGHKFGEFALTRKACDHKKLKKK